MKYGIGFDNQMLMKEVLDKVRAAMDEQGLSIADVARLVGARREAVEHWLTGDYDMKISTIAKLATALNIDLMKVLG